MGRTKQKVFDSVLPKKNIKRRPMFNLTTIGKLVEAFHKDYTIGNACRYAGITTQTYYNWLEKYPAFAQEMDDAQQYLIKQSDVVVASAIKAGDITTVRWYKDRRDPRFKAKSEVDVNHGLQETRDKIKDFLDDRTDFDGASAEPPTANTKDGGEQVAPTS